MIDFILLALALLALLFMVEYVCGRKVAWGLSEVFKWVGVALMAAAFLL